jgi:hypothetical protein
VFWMSVTGNTLQEDVSYSLGAGRLSVTGSWCRKTSIIGSQYIGSTTAERMSVIGSLPSMKDVSSTVVSTIQEGGQLKAATLKEGCQL